MVVLVPAGQRKLAAVEVLTVLLLCHHRNHPDGYLEVARRRRPGSAAAAAGTHPAAPLPQALIQQQKLLHQNPQHQHRRQCQRQRQRQRLQQRGIVSPAAAVLQVPALHR